MDSAAWIRNLSRADFLKSVGLYISRDRLVLARMRKNLQTVSLLEEEMRELTAVEGRHAISELTGWIAEEVREIALKAEGDARERALRQAILSLLPHFNPARDSFYVCVPQDQAIVQPLLLPQAAESNLEQVLEYELERQLPFRREDVFYDFLSMGSFDGKLRVCVFAIPKKSLSGLLDVLGSFGIVPAGVETTATALANYLLFCEPELSGSAAVVGGYDHSWQILGVESAQNGWKSNQRLTFSYSLPQSDWARGIAAELLNDCLRSSPKLYGWGSAGDVLSSLTTDPQNYVDLVGLERQRLKGKPISSSEVLPAVGAALRGLREAAFSVNVLGGPGAKQANANPLSFWNTLLTGLIVLALIAWGVSYPIRDELRMRQLQRANQRLEPSVQALRTEEAQLERARKELAFLSEIDRRKGETLRVLDELSKVIPANAYLSNLRYRAGVLEVQGSAENASALIPVLERSPFFENVAFNAPSNRGRDNRETFSLKAEFEKPKESTKKP